MYKKRLDDALQAAKAIQQGFNMNDSTRINKIDMLYRVNCISRHFEAQNLQIVDNENLETTQVLSLQFNQQANVLAAGDSNGRVQLFDVFSGNALDNENNKLFQESSMPALTVKWHPQLPNILYSANANGSLMQFDREKLKTNLLVKEENQVTCIDVNFNGKYLASVGSDHRIRIYDLGKNDVSLIQTFSSINQNMDEKYRVNEAIDVQLEDRAHSNRLFAIKFSHNESDIFYTGGWDRMIKIWDRRAPKGLVDTIYGPAICGDGLDLKGNFILSASWLRENSLQLWDLRNIKNPFAQLPINNAPDGEYLYSAKFCDNKNDDNKLIMACGSGTKSVHLVDYEKLQNISVLPCSAPLYCIDSLYSGCIFACGSTRNFFVGIGKAQ